MNPEAPRNPKSQNQCWLANQHNYVLLIRLVEPSQGHRFIALLGADQRPARWYYDHGQSQHSLQAVTTRVAFNRLPSFYPLVRR